MNFELPHLLLLCFGYLLCLFGAAYFAERGRLPRRLIHHPLVHALSFGVYASAWTFYGNFSLAAESGYVYLAPYLGAAATFMLTPVLLMPILRITRTYQLSSLADLFAFRFRSGRVGVLTTLALLCASLPLISIQIQAVSDSLYYLNDNVSHHQIAAIFCALIALFAILFGARRASLRNSHSGLVAAIAIQSLIKLGALLTVAAFAFFGVFDGPAGLSAWLQAVPSVLEEMQNPAQRDNWQVMVLAFAGSAVVMPHMFHLAFTENVSSESLYKATWVMPLFLLLLAICVPPIYWANLASGGLAGEANFSALMLGNALNHPWLTLLALLGGLSAASGLMIVAAVALASMMQNHLVLPLLKRPEHTRFYTWLLWLRRFLIVLLIFSCYLFYTTFGERFSLHQLGSLGLIAFVQFLPGLLATLYWPGASRNGFLMGLAGGLGVWLFALTLPLHRDLFLLEIPGGNGEDWNLVTLFSLLLNVGLMILGSLLFPGKEAERQSANACVLNGLKRPLGASAAAGQAEDLQSQLEPRVGPETARREINRARAELNLPAGDLRPLDMLRLRSQLEYNLSGLLGPVEASAILNPQAQQTASGFRAREIHLMEKQLERYDAKLSGLAAELDQLRRYHRLTLQRLPIGACTLDSELRIQFWNSELAKYTGVDDESCIGAQLNNLPAPWAELLSDFTEGDSHHQTALQIELDGAPRWFTLHKAALDNKPTGGMVLLVEDETEYQLISKNLAHQERLASIGQFAAGVAHEIGNPVTGIACLAQNLKLETDNPDILTTGDQIVEQTERISRIVRSLVRFAHTGRHQNSEEQLPTSLHDLAADAIRLVQLDSRTRQQHFANQVPDDLKIMAAPQQMLQVFINLLNNASDASPDDGEIRVAAEAENNRVRLTVTDNGSGISEDDMDRLFEPFFTTKEPGKGTGLGLSLVYNIITEHYGSIELFSPANKNQKNGTQVVITLPRYTGSLS